MFVLFVSIQSNTRRTSSGAEKTMIEHQHQVGKTTATTCSKRAQLAKSMLNERTWRSQTFTPSTRDITFFVLKLRFKSIVQLSNIVQFLFGY